MATFTVVLRDPETLQPIVSPSVAQGDVVIEIDGQISNLTNLPTSRSATSFALDVELTEAENVPGAEVRFFDPDGEWICADVAFWPFGEAGLSDQLANIPQYDQPQVATWIGENGSERTETVIIRRPTQQ